MTDPTTQIKIRAAIISMLKGLQDFLRPGSTVVLMIAPLNIFTVPAARGVLGALLPDCSDDQINGFLTAEGVLVLKDEDMPAVRSLIQLAHGQMEEFFGTPF